MPAGGSRAVTSGPAGVTISYSLDATPPVIVPTVSGTAGGNGWFTSDVGVSWSVTDPDSAIASSSGCAAASVITDTAGETFTCTATRGAQTVTGGVLSVGTRDPNYANNLRTARVTVG